MAITKQDIEAQKKKTMDAKKKDPKAFKKKYSKPVPPIENKKG